MKLFAAAAALAVSVNAVALRQEEGEVKEFVTNELHKIEVATGHPLTDSELNVVMAVADEYQIEAENGATGDVLAQNEEKFVFTIGALIAGGIALAKGAGAAAAGAAVAYGTEKALDAVTGN